MIDKKQNGVYLVVVDSSDELAIAIKYASRFANAEGGYVALLNIMDEQPIQNWQNIEDAIKSELRTQAEKEIWGASGLVIDETGNIPIIYIEEGDISEMVIKTIASNKNIVSLVLASAAGSSPGPLVTYFSGKGLSRLGVPLMIVPNNVESEN